MYLLAGNFFTDTFTMDFLFRYLIMIVAFAAGWYVMRVLSKRLKK